MVNRGGSLIYEPGKCINCGLCIQIAAESQELLGLTFVGRGFDVRVGVPFQGTMDEALGSWRPSASPPARPAHCTSRPCESWSRFRIWWSDDVPLFRYFVNEAEPSGPRAAARGRLRLVPVRAP